MFLGAEVGAYIFQDFLNMRPYELIDLCIYLTDLRLVLNFSIELFL